MNNLYICIEPFLSNRYGREEWVLPDQIAEAGSWPLDVSPHSFEALAIDFSAQQHRRIGRVLAQTIKRHLRHQRELVTSPNDERG